MAKSVAFNIKLNVDGKDIVVAATADVKKMKDAWHDASTGLQKFTEKMFQLNQLNSGIQQFTSSLHSLTESTTSFNSAMKATNTMAGKTGEDFEKLKDQVSELAKTIPLARDELAKRIVDILTIDYLLLFLHPL